MEVLHAALKEVVDLSMRALNDGDLEAARRVEALEEIIDSLCDEFKHFHIENMRTGVYSRDYSFVFNDLLTDIERVSDHCSNIAVGILELQHDEFDTHSYSERMKKQRAEQFDRYFDEYNQKYHF